MKTAIKTITNTELALVAGGVTMSPDGKSCTEHDDVFGKPTGSEESGGPLVVDITTAFPF